MDPPSPVSSVTSRTLGHVLPLHYFNSLKWERGTWRSLHPCLSPGILSPRASDGVYSPAQRIWRMRDGRHYSVGLTHAPVSRCHRCTAFLGTNLLPKR